MSDLQILSAAYLIGMFPSAYLLARCFQKIDIRNTGTGNVGAANAYRSGGLLPGLITLGLDILKGALAVELAVRYGSGSMVAVLAGFLVILAHNFNPLLRFKGGKGLAALVGILIVLAPRTILYVLLLLALMIRLLGDKNIAAGLSAMSIPVMLRLQTGQWEGLVAGMLITLPVFVKYVGDFTAFFRNRRNHA